MNNSSNYSTLLEMKIMGLKSPFILIKMSMILGQVREFWNLASLRLLCLHLLVKKQQMTPGKVAWSALHHNGWQFLRYTAGSRSVTQALRLKLNINSRKQMSQLYIWRENFESRKTVYIHFHLPAGRDTTLLLGFSIAQFKLCLVHCSGISKSHFQIPSCL